MKAIIMAGGEGSRLRPLTCGIPKPMVPVLTEPAIKHIIKHLKKYGIKDIGVTLFYLPDKIKNYLQSEYGNSIRYYIEEKPLGTAGSVKNASDFIDETFVVMSGDVITDIDLKSAYEFHKSKGSKATLVLVKVDIPLEYGVVITDTDGKIEKFLEKPSWGEVFSDTVNTGIYIIEPEVLKNIPEDNIFDFSKDLFPYLLKNHIPMYGYITKNYWCDIGNSMQYLQSHFDILKGNIDLGFNKNLLLNAIYTGENTSISSSAKLIKPVYIGDCVMICENAVIGPNAIIGNGCIIKQGSSIKNSILWDNVKIGPNNELRGCVICNGVKTEKNVRIFENAVLGENSFIKAYSEIKTNVKIWPDKIIDSGIVVNKNVVWGSGIRNLLFGARGIKGVFNEDLTPEYLVSLGEVIGNIFSGNIAIGHDGTNISRYLSDCIVRGMLFAGAEVLYADYALLPALRYIVRKNHYKAGVYIRNEGEDNLRILIMDENGCDIDRGLEKKIENKFMLSDYKRASSDSLKPIKNININKDYTDFLLREKPRNIYGIRVKFMDEITKKVFDFINKNSNMVLITAGNNYDVGIKLSRDGEYIKLYDDTGSIFDDDELNYLRLLIENEYGDRNFVIPFNSSKFLYEMSEAFDFKTVSSKLSHNDKMEKMLEMEGEIPKTNSQFNLSFDGINFSLKLFDYIENKKKKLSEIRKEIPQSVKLNKLVKCEWKDKGLIIKKFYQDSKNTIADFLDGIRFDLGDSWVLIVPDPELAACRLYVEASSKEKAKNLINEYEQTIKKILAEK